MGKLFIGKKVVYINYLPLWNFFIFFYHHQEQFLGRSQVHYTKEIIKMNLIVLKKYIFHFLKLVSFY